MGKVSRRSERFNGPAARAGQLPPCWPRRS
jgi:hypothetical protein